MNTFLYIQWAQYACNAIIGVGAFFIHIIFAIAVLDDAVAIQEKGKKTTFVTGTIWALAVVVGGIFTAAVYWAIHHSTLRPRSASESDPLE